MVGVFFVHPSVRLQLGSSRSLYPQALATSLPPGLVLRPPARPQPGGAGLVGPDPLCPPGKAPLDTRVSGSDWQVAGLPQAPALQGAACAQPPVRPGCPKGACAQQGKSQSMFLKVKLWMPRSLCSRGKPSYSRYLQE